MSKKDFVIKLQKALAGKMDSGEIANHVAYYEEYIEIQVRKGELEEDVVEMLGDPELIAKSILAAAYGSKIHLDENTLHSAGTGLKSVGLQIAQAGSELGHKFKNWFDNLG